MPNEDYRILSTLPDTQYLWYALLVKLVSLLMGVSLFVGACSNNLQLSEVSEQPLETSPSTTTSVSFGSIPSADGPNGFVEDDGNVLPSTNVVLDNSAADSGTEGPRHYIYLSDPVTITQACTPAPGDSSNRTEVIPPSIPAQEAWCYLIQTVDNKYSYAAAITPAIEHHENGYTGLTTTDQIPVPMLELSCEYSPLTNGAVAYSFGDDPTRKNNYRYHVEFFFFPRWQYDKFHAEGPWSLVDITGWNVNLETEGEGFDLSWLQTGWNPPYLDTPIWVSPVDTGSTLYGGGQLNGLFRVTNKVMAHFIYHGIDPMAAPLEAEYHMRIDLPLHKEQLGYANMTISEKTSAEKDYRDGTMALNSSSTFRIDASGDPQTDTWRYDFGESMLSARFGISTRQLEPDRSVSEDDGGNMVVELESLELLGCYIDDPTTVHIVIRFA